jgi:hypothetical protein
VVEIINSSLNRSVVQIIAEFPHVAWGSLPLARVYYYVSCYVRYFGGRPSAESFVAMSPCPLSLSLSKELFFFCHKYYIQIYFFTGFTVKW